MPQQIAAAKGGFGNAGAAWRTRNEARTSLEPVAIHAAAAAGHDHDRDAARERATVDAAGTRR